jgi:hypothetical protein
LASLRSLHLQQEASGLVVAEPSRLACPDGPTGEATSIFVNAAAALAFIAAGELDRAQQILEVFRDADPAVLPDNCAGGYQQHRNVDSGAPLSVGLDEANDFWLGDVAWLLTAFRQYRLASADTDYDASIQQIFDWCYCLWSQTSRPGIAAGYTKSGEDIAGGIKHAEGTIDLYGSINNLEVHFADLDDADRAAQVVEMRDDLKVWLDERVWVPTDDCFERGPDNENDLPLDHVTWGIWALIGADPKYACLLQQEAETALARQLHPGLVDEFAAGLTPWRTQHENDAGAPSPTVMSLTPVPYAELGIAYDIGTNGVNWALASRDAAIDVTAAFKYYVGQLDADASGAGFEIKLYGSVSWRDSAGAPHTSCASVINAEAPLAATTLGPFELGWSDFEWFVPPAQAMTVRLDHISRIEFAVGALGQPRAGNVALSAPLAYTDVGLSGVALEGFTDFSSRQDVLWVEGTGHMALTYCLVGESAAHQFYLSQLDRMFVGNEGLPSFIAPGHFHAPPNSVANAWYVLAGRCVNPFSF